MGQEWGTSTWATWRRPATGACSYAGQVGGHVGAPPPSEKTILVFSTNGISDPGIDLAGSAHMNYSAGRDGDRRSLLVGGISPDWLVHAIEKGFDGVFVAADGGDCALVPDCTARTAWAVERAQELLSERGHDPRRLKMGGDLLRLRGTVRQST